MVVIIILRGKRRFFMFHSMVVCLDKKTSIYGHFDVSFNLTSGEETSTFLPKNRNMKTYMTIPTMKKYYGRKLRDVAKEIRVVLKIYFKWKHRPFQFYKKIQKIIQKYKK